MVWGVRTPNSSANDSRDDWNFRNTISRGFACPVRMEFRSWGAKLVRERRRTGGNWRDSWAIWFRLKRSQSPDNSQERFSLPYKYNKRHKSTARYLFSIQSPSTRKHKRVPPSAPRPATSLMLSRLPRTRLPSEVFVEPIYRLCQSFLKRFLDFGDR